MTDIGSGDETEGADGASSLAMVPSSVDAGEAALLDWFCEEGSLSERNLLIVQCEGSPDDWLQALASHDDHPNTLEIVSTGDEYRSATERGEAPAPARDEDRSRPRDPVSTVPDPTDLQSLGKQVILSLDELSETTAHSLVVTDSVSDMLARLDRTSVVQFLHILQHRLRDAPATGRFLVTPERHDHETVLLLQSLFDHCEEYDPSERTLAADQLQDPLKGVLSGPRLVVVEQLLSDGSTSMASLAGRVADARSDCDSDWLRATLVETHLPILEASGLVEHDPASDTVSLAVPRERVEPYLHLARNHP